MSDERMSQFFPRKSNASIENKRNAASSTTRRSARSRMMNESVDGAHLHDFHLESMNPIRSRQAQNYETKNDFVEKSSLTDYRYCFDAQGKLVSLDDGKPFRFNVCRNDHDNQTRYHAIGRAIDEYIYEQLEGLYHLKRIQIPIDARPGEPTGFFFASEDFQDADKLMIIIHGTGVVRAGQWSRKLIINENIHVGSQFEYILHAKQLGFAVIVTNTNLNTDESTRFIRGSETAEQHGCYVWENFVRQSVARHICIVAHSYGGAVMLEMASRYTPDFDKRVFAVVLTDSPMKCYIKNAHPNVLKVLKKRTINWVASTAKVNTKLGDRDYGLIRSAGHTLHEWTSHTACVDIFRFITEAFQQVQRYKH
ncbi:unnamed protein product [Adineta ricciae]|uniref:Arb2 domain-containing protein n=1 Tax=Adineta ricciae TaxID=249248 RepID=A0A814B628_ADIRI|nr:unnamed protein product [Adineta ricciae]